MKEKEMEMEELSMEEMECVAGGFLTAYLITQATNAATWLAKEALGQIWNATWDGPIGQIGGVIDGA